jgi:hypothetical protein
MRRLLPLLSLAAGCKLFVDPTIAETCEDLGTCDGDGDGDADTDTPAGDADGDGYTVADGDCNDGNADIHPGAAEVCDDGGVDENCDGLVNDEDPAVTGTVEIYADLDGDGWGDVADGQACRPSDGQAELPGDCDDGDAAVNPDAEELCNNGKDDDCDGTPGECLPYEGAMGRVFASPAVVSSGPDELFGLWATAGDLTGDARDDLALSGPTAASGAGVVLLFSGLVSEDGRLATDADASIRGDAGSYLGVGMATGDLDGDGQADIVVRDTDDVAHVFAGPLDGELTASDVWMRVESVGEGSLEAGALVVADLSGDGTADLLLGDQYAGVSPDRGAVYGFDSPHASGRFDGPSEADRVLEGSADGTPGFELATGDFDGDGVLDIVTSDPYAATPVTPSGQLWIVRDGPATGTTSISDVSDAVSGTREGGLFGITLATGDLDGDGRDDLVAGAPGSSPTSGGQVFVFQGAPEGMRTVTSARTTIAQPEVETYMGYEVVVADISGDGQADLAIAEPAADAERGAIHLLYGPIPGGRQEPSALDAVIRGSVAEVLYGYGLHAAGDLDGDGSHELAVSGDINAVDVLFGGGW